MRVNKHPCGIGRSNENGGRLLGMDFNVSLSKGRTVTLIEKIRWKAEYHPLVTGLREGRRRTRQVYGSDHLVRHSSDNGSVEKKLGGTERSIEHGSVQGQFPRLSPRDLTCTSHISVQPGGRTAFSVNKLKGFRVWASGLPLTNEY
ncbi:hypothetical protein CROQUDRAFT_87785 [Cronartium quercuum f. sp. fusiforme G11]|uniref:Uncharacterized protein n=1 Tax=Cronartium quercuum f. sp. fusiforme G11 TaxID=708437 RepID=A0A9P6NUM8_9BASI|nr:hypothetical protein CROQUDRAFT_87785 [Cronartium quercuum f. sp. fusiforme G11]